MSLLRDSWVFASRVSKRWWALVAAMTVATTVLWLVQPEFPFSVLPPLVWLITCLLVVLAAFGVWREEYLQVRDRELPDAEIIFDPVRGDGLLQFRISQWIKGPRLIPPKIGLLVWFSLVNRGRRAGTLDRVSVRLPQATGESRIVFRSLGLHQYAGEGGARPLTPGDSFRPEEPVRVACHLSAEVHEDDPSEFAEQIGMLCDFDLELIWSFHAVGDSVTRSLVVPVQVTKLQQIVFSHWGETEHRDDLIRIAQGARSTARKEEQE